MPEFTREIHSFVEIARERSIRRAAEKLNIASSALSRQMRLLEEDFGTRLIERRVTGVQLTEAGRLLLSQAERWLDESNRLRAELRQSGAAEALRLGAMECFAGTLMPDLFLHARRSGAAGRIDVRYGGTDTLLQALQEGNLDLVVAFNVQNSQSVRVVSELPTRLGMVCSPTLCDPPDPEIDLARALEWPVCLPDQSLSSHTRLYAEILKQHRNPRISGLSNSIEFIRELVIRGDCVSFLSWFDVREQVLDGRLRFIPLAERRLSERICVCVSGARPFTAALAQLARETFRRLEALAAVDRPAVQAHPADDGPDSPGRNA
jgi:DNA-binding transcriptional LysR family regulator